MICDLAKTVYAVIDRELVLDRIYEDYAAALEYAKRTNGKIKLLDLILYSPPIDPTERSENVKEFK